MKLSIVIPCYNSATFIEESLHSLNSYYQEKKLEFEIIAVNDGSTDNTLEKLKSLDIPALIIIDSKENEGKFSSISKGVARARGECIAFTDADIPYDIAVFEYALKIIQSQEIHFVIGDRTLHGAVYDNQLPILRKLNTKVLRILVRLVSLGGIHDSQCGFKAIRKDIAKNIFKLLSEKRYSGDIEILYIALKYNLVIKRIPVRLKRAQESSVGPLKTSLEILRCLGSLKLRHLLGRYEDENLKKISSQQYWEM